MDVEYERHTDVLERVLIKVPRGLSDHNGGQPTDSIKCQTLRAPPAEPWGLPFLPEAKLVLL